MKLIRTPESRFEGLSGYDFEGHYFEKDGLRIHFLDEGKQSAQVTFLCLHGEPTWSYLYRKMIPMLAERGRVLVPDLAGFGKSDKPAEISDHCVAFHLDILEAFISHTGARKIVLVCQDWGGLLGLPLAMELAPLFHGLVIMNTGLPDPAAISLLNPANWLAATGFLAWRAFAMVHPDLPVGGLVSAGCWPPWRLTAEIVAAYDAPFPDKFFKAGPDAFSGMVPLTTHHPSLPFMRRARAKLEKSAIPKLVMFSDRDPITWSQRNYFTNLPGVLANLDIRGAGHFLQEDQGELLAENILKFF